MNDFEKLSLPLQSRSNAACILWKRRSFSLTENLDNSLHAGCKYEVVPLVMCIHLRPGGRGHTYNARCELIFILGVRAVQSHLSGMKQVHAFFDMCVQPS